MDATCVIPGMQTAGLRVRVKSMKPKPPIPKEEKEPSSPPTTSTPAREEEPTPATPPVIEQRKAPLEEKKPPQSTPLEKNKKTSGVVKTGTMLLVLVGLVVIVVALVALGIWAINSGKGTSAEDEKRVATPSTATMQHFTTQYKSVIAPVGSYSEPLELHATQCLGLTGEGEVPRDAKFVWQTYWNGNWSDPVAATLKAQLPRNSSKVRFTSNTGAPQHVLVTLIPCGAPDMVAIRKKS